MFETSTLVISFLVACVIALCGYYFGHRDGYIQCIEDDLDRRIEQDFNNYDELDNRIQEAIKQTRCNGK